MQAALPFVEHFIPAHDLESLERLLPLLAADGRTQRRAGPGGPRARQGAAGAHGTFSAGSPPGA